MQKAVNLDFNGQTMRGMEHYPDTGEGPFPAVLINHGFTGHKGGVHRIHVHISRALVSIGFAAVRYDFIGSGESDGEFSEMTLSSEITQAHAVYESMLSNPMIDSERIYILGHSMGGVVASSLCGDLAVQQEKPLPAGLILMAPAGNMLDVLDKSRWDHRDHIFEDGSVDHCGFHVSLDFMDDLQEVMSGLPKRVGTYSGPVRIIHGTVDEAVPLQVGIDFTGYYQQAVTLHQIDEADHVFGNLGHEAELIDEIKRFLTL